MKDYLRKTKIVGTIGPASDNILEDLFDAGLNVCRINYSHGSYEEQADRTNEIIRIREEKELPIAMILDMKGPEIRTGMLYTGDKIYKIDVLYFESVNAYSKVYSLTLKRNESNKELIKEFEKDVITKNSSIKASSKDKLILLSTCNSSDTETRSVLVGKITEVEESKIINEKQDITLSQIDKQLSDKQKEENAKEIIKDKEESNTYAKKIIIMIVIIVIIAIT